MVGIREQRGDPAAREVVERVAQPFLVRRTEIAAGVGGEARSGAQRVIGRVEVDEVAGLCALAGGSEIEDLQIGVSEGGARREETFAVQHAGVDVAAMGNVEAAGGVYAIEAVVPGLVQEDEARGGGHRIQQRAGANVEVEAAAALVVQREIAAGDVSERGDEPIQVVANGAEGGDQLLVRVGEAGLEARSSLFEGKEDRSRAEKRLVVAREARGRFRDDARGELRLAACPFHERFRHVRIVERREVVGKQRGACRLRSTY